MSAVFSFLVYGILGWGIDSGYRSLSERRWTSRNALKPLPICPIYGFGALFVLAMDSSLAGSVAWPLRGLIYGVVLALFEAVSGIVTQRVTGKRLWNYGHARNVFRGSTRRCATIGEILAAHC